MARKPKDPKAAERKARQRAKLREEGMEPREIWALRSHWPHIERAIRETVDRLKGGT